MRAPTMVAVMLALVGCVGTAHWSVLSSLPPRTCDLLDEPVTIAPFGTVLESLRGLLFRSPADVIVYLDANVTPSSVDALRARFESDQRVKSTRYLDHDAALSEFQSLFSGQPSVAKSLTPGDTPTSFRIILTDVAREEEFRSAVVGLPGVREVIDASGTIRKQMTAVEAELKPKLKALLSAGGTAALIEMVGLNQRLYAALDKDPSARLFGAGGAIDDDEIARFSAAADTLRGEIARDCAPPGVSS